MLSWWAHHGKHLKSYEEYELEGRRMAVLDNQPAIFEGNEWIFDAFMALDTCRAPAVMGPPGPIPWLAVMEYGRELEIDRAERGILWAVLHRADMTFRAEMGESSR